MARGLWRSLTASNRYVAIIVKRKGQLDKQRLFPDEMRRFLGDSVSHAKSYQRGLSWSSELTKDP